jgi:hypothetical protein
VNTCELCDGPTKRPGLCPRCRSSLIGLRVVDGGPGLDETIVARGGYPPPLSEVLGGDDDD